MDDAHTRFEELALGHVLGGLPSEEAAEFRAHLIECRDCRMRVAELRDIADSLAATEREERRLAAVATQVAQDEEGDGELPWWRRLVPLRWLQVGLIGLAVVAILSILFWNYHLRRVSTELSSVAATYSDALDVIARGEAVPARGREGVSAQAAVLDDEVAVVAGSLPRLSDDARLVVWLVADGRYDRLQTFLPAVDRPLVVIAVHGGADELIVTVEHADGEIPHAPSGRQLVAVDIPLRI